MLLVPKLVGPTTRPLLPVARLRPRGPRRRSMVSSHASHANKRDRLTRTDGCRSASRHNSERRSVGHCRTPGNPSAAVVRKYACAVSLRQDQQRGARRASSRTRQLSALTPRLGRPVEFIDMPVVISLIDNMLGALCCKDIPSWRSLRHRCAGCRAYVVVVPSPQVLP